MRVLVLGLVLSLILAGTASARSIDCLKAATDIERLICANNYLRHHDSTMSYAGRMSHFCAVPHSIRVIFDRHTQRFFVATGKGYSFDAAGKSTSFFPPVSQWPPTARKALDAFQGEIKWRGDDPLGNEPDPAPPSVLDYRR